MNELDSKREGTGSVSVASNNNFSSKDGASCKRPVWVGLLTHRWTLLVLRLAIGGIFVYAAYSKIGNPQAFADSIATFQLLPAAAINLVAIALPPFEVLLGVLLLTGWRARAGLLGALLLTAVFVVALGQGLARGLEIDCGCFGSGKPSVLSGWISFGRALLLAVVSGWALFLEARRTGANNQRESRDLKEPGSRVLDVQG